MTSYVKMSAEEVRKLAQETIDDILKERANRLENWLIGARERDRKSWLRKFWRHPLSTDEQLIDTEYSRGIFNDITRINIYAWKSMDIARDLLNASELSSEMTISVDDLKHIG